MLRVIATRLATVLLLAADVVAVETKDGQTRTPDGKPTDSISTHVKRLGRGQEAAREESKKFSPEVWEQISGVVRSANRKQSAADGKQKQKKQTRRNGKTRKPDAKAQILRDTLYFMGVKEPSVSRNRDGSYRVDVPAVDKRTKEVRTIRTNVSVAQDGGTVSFARMEGDPSLRAVAAQKYAARLLNEKLEEMLATAIVEEEMVVTAIVEDEGVEA